jgi:hypothetical protein
VANAQNLFYYVLAFIVGYREETARALIQRVGDVIIGPGDAATKTATESTTISALPPSGTPDSQIRVVGTGLTRVQGVTFGGTEATFNAESDTQLTVRVPPGEGTVTVSFVLASGDLIARQFSYN